MIHLLLAAALAFGPSKALSAAEHTTAIVWADLHVTDAAGDTQDVGEVALCTAVEVYNHDSKGTAPIMVTAGHCVHDEDETDETGDKIHLHADILRLQFFDGDEASILGTSYSKKDDIGLIAAHSKRRHTPAAMFAHPPSRGEHVYVFGGPNDELWSFQNAMATQGSQYSMAGPGFDYDYSLECTSCGPGDSGAGVWDSHGRLIGIVSGGTKYATYMVPINRL